MSYRVGRISNSINNCMQLRLRYTVNLRHTMCRKCNSMRHVAVFRRESVVLQVSRFNCLSFVFVICLHVLPSRNFNSSWAAVKENQFFIIFSQRDFFCLKIIACWISMKIQLCIDRQASIIRHKKQTRFLCWMGFCKKKRKDKSILNLISHQNLHLLHFHKFSKRFIFCLFLF